MFLVNNHEKEDLNMFEDQDLKFISSSPFHSTFSNREDESLNPSPKNMKEKENFLGRKLSSTTVISEAEISTMMKRKKVVFQTVNSVDEDSELKKEMKKLKNRSSAKKYRDNQKVYISQMEAMIEKLHGEINVLRNSKTGNKNDLDSLFDKLQEKEDLIIKQKSIQNTKNKNNNSIPKLAKEYKELHSKICDNLLNKVSKFLTPSPIKKELNLISEDQDLHLNENDDQKVLFSDSYEGVGILKRQNKTTVLNELMHFADNARNYI